MSKGVVSSENYPEDHSGYRAYFHQALMAFPYKQAVNSQFHLLKISKESDDLWTCFAPYTLAIHCLNDKGENVALEPVQCPIDAKTCEAYQGEADAFARDAVAVMKAQAAAYPETTVRAAFYVPMNGLLINVLEEREGENLFTLNKDDALSAKEKSVEAHEKIFADFYEKGRDFYASWIDAVQEFEAARVQQKSQSKLWSFFHNAETEKSWTVYAKQHLLKSIGFYSVAA